MRIENCWCGKSSPIRFVREDRYQVVWECLMCLGTVTVYLNPGEAWEERSSNE